MKRFAVLTMIVGILATSSSIVFAITDERYNNILLGLYWGLLLGFQLLLAWVFLFSNLEKFKVPQKILLAALIVLVFVWIFLVSTDANAKAIFIWALKILNYSGLYFVGLFIYYRESQISKK